jgi:hypothetical protein
MSLLRGHHALLIACFGSRCVLYRRRFEDPSFPIATGHSDASALPKASTKIVLGGIGRDVHQPLARKRGFQMVGASQVGLMSCLGSVSVASKSSHGTNPPIARNGDPPPSELFPKDCRLSHGDVREVCDSLLPSLRFVPAFQLNSLSSIQHFNSTPRLNSFRCSASPIHIFQEKSHRLRANEFCPIHRSVSCCGRETIPKPRQLRLGVQRIEDPHHPRGYRELRSPGEMRKLLNRKIRQQAGICAICHEEFTDYNEHRPYSGDTLVVQ